MLYTITHGKHRTSTAESYQQYLDIVNKETLLSVAETLGISGVAKSHAETLNFELLGVLNLR